MKKIYVLLLFLFLSLCVISCSKEDPVIDINKPGSGTVIPTPTPTPEPEPLPTETVSTSFVNYDFEKAEVLACDTASGNYSLRFDGEVPDITSGSVVLVNCDTTNYVVLVTKASTKDKEVDITGAIGDLSYVFFNTEFTLQTGTIPTTKAYGGRVYYPQEYYTRATWDYTLWSTSVHEENDLYKSAKSRIWTEADFNASLNATLTFEFGSPIKNVIEGVEFMRAGKYTVDASITGGIDASYDLYMNYRDKGEVKLHPKDNDKYAMLKHNLFPQKSVIFPVGGVPIPVTFSSDLYADVSLSYEGKLDFNTGISASVSGALGLKYDAINNSGLTPYNELTLGYERRDPSLTGYGKVEGKCHIFPRVRACIGGAVGPSLDIKPYAKVSLEGGFKETLGGSSSDYLASLVKTFVGLDAAVGISTTFFNYENWNLSTPDVNIFEAQLFESPVEIEFLEAKKLSDRSYDVSFKVSDRYFDGNNYTSILWPIVNFEAEGTLSSKFVFSEQGIATVNWMPSKRPSKIYARINNPDGSVIDEAEYECEEDEIRDLLVRLYQSTDGDNWIRNDNWCTDEPIENWYGVSYSGPELISIQLSNNNLTGSADLSGFKNLHNLGLDGNRLSKLNVRNCTSLERLWCNDGTLASIDAFGCISLDRLWCNNNNLTSLDVSGCSSLDNLICHNNKLTALDLSRNYSLEYLECYHNNLAALDISGAKLLKELNCNENNLTSLDLSDFTLLKELYCGDNNLTSINVSNNKSLELFWCTSNNLVALDVSDCPSLHYLYCGYNELSSIEMSAKDSLISLDCQHNNLTDIDLSGYSALETLSVESSNLLSLDVSNCTSLIELQCFQNSNLASLNVSGCTKLNTLFCHENNLSSLDVSGCTKLNTLFCHENNLSSLDVSGCVSLEILLCSNNNLSSLDLSGCNSINTLYCYHNRINHVIYGIFDTITSFGYDQKYSYWYDGNGVLHTETNDYGWWYPGEPEKGYHGK